MLRPASLKRHILILALAAILLVWLAAAAFTYVDARDELNDMLDAHLAQASALLVAQSTHELEEIETETVALQHKYSLRVAFQLWEDGSQLRLRSANAPWKRLTQQENGFSDTRIGGQRWRVFSAWDDTHAMLVQVAEKTDVRDELARNIATNLLRPLWLALPLLAALLWWAVAVGLRPLIRLTQDIDQRAPDNLAPLDASATPDEVTPLIERLNHLFVRIGSTLENERRFTADAAHELRTPVAAIKAQAQVARGATDDAARLHALDQAIAGCDRAAHLIEQLLTLARLDSTDASARMPVPLRALAAEVMAEIAPAALQRGVQLELTESEDLSIDGLPPLLRILLRNLLDNAVRHTPQGTQVRVDLLRLRGKPCLRVTDDGPGLPQPEMERLAQRFYRPPGTAASGSGIGLSIVRRIAEIHGAVVEFSVPAGATGLQTDVRFMGD